MDCLASPPRRSRRRFHVQRKAHSLWLKGTATVRLPASLGSSLSLAIPMTSLRGGSWLRETRTRIERA
jgi:hypothetical protein